jgi:hypothetical protein
VWISTFGRKVRFNARGGDVGRFYRDRLSQDSAPFEATLSLPEDALSNALICLGSVWKDHHNNTHRCFLSRGIGRPWGLSCLFQVNEMSRMAPGANLPITASFTHEVGGDPWREYPPVAEG